VTAGRPPRRREVTNAATAVADAIAWHGLSDELRAERIVTDWRELVGPRISTRAWPDGISRSGRGDSGARVLWVRVVSSAWLHELTLLKDQLTATIKDGLGQPPLFDELRLHLGAPPKDVIELAGGRVHGPPRRRRPTPVAASGERRQAIEAETAVVDDAELRAVIRDVRVRNDR
jgi:hypothetical protein